MPLSDSNRLRLERLLCDLDPQQGAAAEVRRAGYLWTRTTAHRIWHRAARIRGHEVQAAAA
jgi:hypothetical protein